MVDYTSRDDAERHLRTDYGIEVEHALVMRDVYAHIDTQFFNAENGWSWNDQNPEIHRAERASYMAGNFRSTFFYSMLSDLVQFIETNWAEKYGPKWTERNIQLFIFTDALYFHDDHYVWRRSDEQACNAKACPTCVETAYQFSPEEMCQLTSALSATFKAGVTLWPTNMESRKGLECKMGGQLTQHLQAACGVDQSPFILPEGEHNTLDELVEYISNAENTHAIGDDLCCKSGQFIVTHNGETEVTLEKDYNDRFCPTGSCYKQPNGSGGFNQYPKLYRSNDAWVYMSDAVSFEVTDPTNKNCCPQDIYGRFLSTATLSIECLSSEGDDEWISASDSSSEMSFSSSTDSDYIDNRN